MPSASRAALSAAVARFVMKSPNRGFSRSTIRFGACARCQGFGNTIDFDMDLVIPDKSKTLAEGAVEPWTKPKYRPIFTELRRWAREKKIPVDVPWFQLSHEQHEAMMEGDDDFIGIRGFFAHLERKKYKLHVRVFLSRYRGYATCGDCGGQRLRQKRVRCAWVARTSVKCAVSPSLKRLSSSARSR